MSKRLIDSSADTTNQDETPTKPSDSATSRYGACSSNEAPPTFDGIVTPPYTPSPERPTPSRRLDGSDLDESGSRIQSVYGYQAEADVWFEPLMREICMAMDIGVVSELSAKGSSGCYFMRGTDNVSHLVTCEYDVIH